MPLSRLDVIIAATLGCRANRGGKGAEWGGAAGGGRGGGGGGHLGRADVQVYGQPAGGQARQLRRRGLHLAHPRHLRSATVHLIHPCYYEYHYCYDCYN